MELTLASLFFFLFGALCVLFTQAFWIQNRLRSGKVAHVGKKLIIMTIFEFREQLKIVTDLRILCADLKEKLDECKEKAPLVVEPQVVEKKVRKPRVSKKKAAEES